MKKDPTAFKQRFEAYKNGKSVKEIYDAGYIKEPVITPDPLYNEYINSLPDNQRLTPESLYRSHRYWELNGKPKNFGEAIGRGMFTYDFTDNSWHANSVALNKKTDEYEFMKPNWHNTKMYEDAWYYSKDGADFRSEYTKKPGVAYDKYISRFKDDKLPGFKEGKDSYRYLYDNLSGSWNRITNDENTDTFANFVVTPNGSRPTFSMYENTPNPTLPVSKNESVIPDNTLWTRQLVEKANNTRTWRSDVADVMHSIGEGAMLASTFAAPEVEPLVNPAYQAIKGIITNTTRSNASKILANPRNFLFVIPEVPYEILNIPGYLLKTLMRGNQLEKQLSKTGTISVNSIKANASKASEVEKEVIGKVLSSEQFAGQNAVDYNDFRKAVLDELIIYSRKPLTRYEDYGVNGLGYSKKILGSDATVGDIEAQYPGRFLTVIRPLFKMVDTKTGRIVTNNSELQLLVADLNKEGGILYNTFTFESPRIPIGNAKHYNPTTLGHSRTYTTKDEPEILHVMESQSDWGQSKYSMINPESLRNVGYFSDGSAIDMLTNKVYDKEIIDLLFESSNIQPKYLHDNYLRRLLQENLKYAAEHGQTKMRYPTSETAAKIEGYQKQFLPEVQSKAESLKNAIAILNNPNSKVRDIQGYGIPIEYSYGETKEQLLDRFTKELTELELKKSYMPEHQTILKKYSDFPKMYGKLYKGAKVRTVTDTKGNTWYEVDVPKDYLNLEWQYNFGKDLFRRTILKPKLKF